MTLAAHMGEGVDTIQSTVSVRGPPEHIYYHIGYVVLCILSGQEDSGGEVVVPWRESLRGFSHPAVHGRR